MPGDPARVAPGEAAMSPRTPAIAATLLIACAGPALGQAPGVRLPDIGVTGKRSPCRVHPERAAETAELWILAKEALEGSVRSEPGAPTQAGENGRRSATPSPSAGCAPSTPPTRIPPRPSGSWAATASAGSRATAPRPD